MTLVPEERSMVDIEYSVVDEVIEGKDCRNCYALCNYYPKGIALQQDEQEPKSYCSQQINLFNNLRSVLTLEGPDAEESIYGIAQNCKHFKHKVLDKSEIELNELKFKVEDLSERIIALEKKHKQKISVLENEFEQKTENLIQLLNVMTKKLNTLRYNIGQLDKRSVFYKPDIIPMWDVNYKELYISYNNLMDTQNTFEEINK